MILHLQFFLLLLDSYTVHLSFFGPSSLHLYSVMPSSSYQMLFQNLQSKYIRYFQIPDSSRISFCNCISRTTTFSKSKLISPYKIPGLCLNSVSKNLEQYL